jgi:hypothetical protein
MSGAWTHGERLERTLRGLCRCDGLKDAAAIAALIAVSGALVLWLVGGGGGPGHHPREEYRSAGMALVVRS